MNDDQKPEEAIADDGELELFQRLRGWHRESMDHLSDWREQAREDFSFVSGDQWGEEEKALLKQQMRPIITYNRIGPITDSVSGLEVGNRQEVHYYPREVGDSGPNELLNNAAKFFREETDTEDEESDAFQDALICGIGATEIRPDYEDDPEGTIPTERLDPLGIFYDPAAKKRNLVDRRYCGYEKEMPLEEAKGLFPDFEEEDLDAGWASSLKDGGQEPHDATEAPYYRNDQSDRAGKKPKRVTVVYFEWWDREKYWITVDPATNQKMELDEEKWGVLVQRMETLGMPPPQAAAMTRKVYKHAFVGAKILRTGPGRCKTDFTVNFITGKRDRNKNTWYGIVRAMKDPQRWANKFFSQILHIINSNAKGGAFVEKTALDNPKKAEEDWATPSSLIILKDGALSKGQIQARPAITYPVGLDRMMEFSVSSIRDVTGVNLELLGMADRDQPGVLEAQRKQAGMTILAVMFDSLRRYRKIAGRVLLYLIQKNIPPGRLIRIDGENGPKYAPLVLDPSQTKYDVIVDDAPMSVNQKDNVWAMLVQMMPLLQRAPLPAQVWADIIKYSPMPETLAVKIGQGLVAQEQAAAQKPDPEMEKAKMKAQADLVAAQQQMQLEQQQAQQEATLAKAKMIGEMHLDAQKQQFDMALEQQRAKFDMMLQAREAEMEAKLAMAKAHMEHTIALEQAKRQGEDKDKERAHVSAENDKAASTMSEFVRALTAPKKVIRDESGRVEGVESVI